MKSSWLSSYAYTEWLLFALRYQLTDMHSCFAVGVTLWEVFSYGKRPYENTPAMELPDFLERGARLAPPSICTSYVYLLMADCTYHWLKISRKHRLEKLQPSLFILHVSIA